ncbi:hypothetical protein [Nonomuraea sp. NPDC049709]|uniref:hypothetical protein n=1 Tax=Nonomuraea sp. NPDC049709 TaxID=3154736 RepID=UPI00341D1616
MFMRSARRAATVTGLFFLGASVLTATPAYAGVRGDIRNDLPASYTVKIATFGGGSSSCRTWNAGTQRCTHWWLPSGKADEGTDGIRPGMDTDGFMVEQPVLVVLPTGVAIRVAAFTWTKISDFEDVHCSVSGGARCVISS